MPGDDHTGRPKSVSDDELVAALRSALAAGDRDGLGGGVRPDAVADRVGLSLSRSTARLRTLVREGRLVQVHGIGADGSARLSYLPADHPDVSEVADAE